MLNVCIYGYSTKFLTHNVGICGKIYYLYDYINHLIDKVIRYSFETKANKIYANKVASYAEEDAAKIIPTKFSLDVEIEEKEYLIVLLIIIRFILINLVLKELSIVLLENCSI